MHILVTNDDGVRSPGLIALKTALQEIGTVSVVAPNRNWSAGGHSRTLFEPLRAMDVTLEDGTVAIACDGTPADCVALAVMGLLDEKPDIIVSGINQGPNLGHDVLYSGTVAAAMEGLILGIPAIAISLVNGYKPEADFAAASLWASRIVKQAIKYKLPAELLLNVNVPAGTPQQIKSAVTTRLGERIYRDELIVRHDPRGRPYYWVGGEEPSGIIGEGTDLGAIASGVVSITPLHFDLTSLDWLQQLGDIQW